MSGLKEGKNELYVELRELDQRIQGLNSHIQNIDEQISELNSSIVILNKFKELKEGEEIRVPIASGIYIDAKIGSKKDLLANVGSGVLVEKAPDEIVVLLESQIEEINNYREQLVNNMKELLERAEDIQREIG